MGNWNISIEGVGIHHNGLEDDAEQMAAKFVQLLKESGQSVVKASFTYGGSIDLFRKENLLRIEKK